MNNPLNIAIAGLGTVGAGTYRILSEKAELLARRAGRELQVVAVSARDRSRDRGVDLEGVAWHEDARELASAENVSLVVECIGGADGIAYELCKSALENGKHVVTANKALIATHGTELTEIAEQNNVALAFEAAVAGGIPIIKALREGLAANSFTRVSGILNGTCNYILTAMAEEQRDFTSVLEEAQEKGYAETPPDLDIDGIDAAHKLAILTALAYGCPVNFDAVYMEGIRDVSLADITYAAELGYVIRLLGVAHFSAGATHLSIEQRVHPCLVKQGSAMAAISGVTNAVQVEGDAVGPVLLTGAGAGAGPTGSSVVADIVDIAAGRISPSFGVPVDRLEPREFVSMEEHVGEYYIRLLVSDQPGVLADVTSVFSAHQIGVEQVLQKANERSATAQIALITHETDEVAIQKVLAILGKKETVLEPPHMIRIEN